MFVTPAIPTSLAVQLRFWVLPCAFQMSWMQLFAAYTGWEAAPKTSAAARIAATAIL
jgi:hypothetical protein